MITDSPKRLTFNIFVRNRACRNKLHEPLLQLTYFIVYCLFLICFSVAFNCL